MFNLRFMPEPNLPPLRLIDQDQPSENYNILNINDYRKNLPELPSKTRSKLIDSYELSADHAFRLCKNVPPTRFPCKTQYSSNIESIPHLAHSIL